MSWARCCVLVGALLLAAFDGWVGALGAAEQRFDVPIGVSQQKGPATAPVTFIEFLDFQ